MIDPFMFDVSPCCAITDVANRVVRSIGILFTGLAINVIRFGGACDNGTVVDGGVPKYAVHFVVNRGRIDPSSGEQSLEIGGSFN